MRDLTPACAERLSWGGFTLAFPSPSYTINFSLLMWKHLPCVSVCVFLSMCVTEWASVLERMCECVREMECVCVCYREGCNNRIFSKHSASICGLVLRLSGGTSLSSPHTVTPPSRLPPHPPHTHITPPLCSVAVLHSDSLVIICVEYRTDIISGSLNEPSRL